MMETGRILGEEIESYNRRHLECLRKEIMNHNVSWVLGAGLSVPAGLPQWDTLLMNMWVLITEINNANGKRKNADAFEKQYDYLKNELCMRPNYKAVYMSKFYSALKGSGAPYLKGLNVLEASEYLWNSIQEHTSLESSMGNADMKGLKVLIREALLLGVDDGRQLERILHDENVQAKLKNRLENECISVIAQILKTNERGNVITYNFEDLFEFCLEKNAGIDREDIWIGCDNHREPGNQAFRVYHPHGKIQIFSNCEPRESMKIVLTESSYYSMEREVYNWANSIQAKEFAERSCVFVGFSGTDYNFRRIIKNCQEQKGEKCHYIFVGIDSLILKFLGNVDVENKLCDPEYIYERMQMLNFCSAQTKYWKKYGIIPIWTTFQEMPGLLRNIGGPSHLN